MLVRAIRQCSSAAVRPQRRWDIWVGVCMERPAVVATPRTELEEEFLTMCLNREVERSLLSGHELKKKQEKIRAEKLAQDEDFEDDDEKQVILTQDIEDAAKEQLAAFNFASTLTEADKMNDMQSLNRCLKENIYLVVKQKVVAASQPHWMFPLAKPSEGETLRQTCERIINELDPNVKYTIFGNAPVGMYKYKYTKKLIQTQNIESDGAKVFLYKSRLSQKSVMNPAESEFIRGHKWLTFSELPITLCKDSYRGVKPILFK